MNTDIPLSELLQCIPEGEKYTMYKYYIATARDAQFPTRGQGESQKEGLPTMPVQVEKRLRMAWSFLDQTDCFSEKILEEIELHYEKELERNDILKRKISQREP